MMDKLIKELYDKTLNDVIKDIPSKYVELFKQGYLDELKVMYNNIELVEGKYDEALKGELKELKFYSLLSVNERLCLFVKDNAFEFIRSHFINSKRLVEQFNQGLKIKEFDVSKVEEQLNKVIKQVYDFNEFRADELLASAVQNYNYVLGKSIAYSIR